MPTNRRLMATDLEGAVPDARVLIERWNRLRAVRTGLGLTATAAFLQTSMHCRRRRRITTVGPSTTGFAFMLLMMPTLESVPISHER